MINFHEKKESGQTMLLMVIIIAAAAISAMTFSSFTVISEMRQVTDARATSSALFAADAGIECILFHEFGKVTYGLGCPACPSNPAVGYVSPEVELFSGGPKFNIQLVSKTINGANETSVWVATGKDSLGKASRSFRLTLRKLI
jgi:hypothetical protein